MVLFTTTIPITVRANGIQVFHVLQLSKVTTLCICNKPFPLLFVEMLMILWLKQLYAVFQEEAEHYHLIGGNVTSNL